MGQEPRHPVGVVVTIEDATLVFKGVPERDADADFGEDRAHEVPEEQLDQDRGSPEDPDVEPAGARYERVRIAG